VEEKAYSLGRIRKHFWEILRPILGLVLSVRWKKLERKISSRPAKGKSYRLSDFVSEAEPNLEPNQTADCCSNETQNWVREKMNICHVI